MVDFVSSLLICDDCHKVFKTEISLLSHNCKIKERREIIRTREGLLSRQVYSYWLSKQKRKVPELEVFISSKLFVSFLNFAKFFYSHTDSDWEPYIDLMIAKKISPNNWTNKDIIHVYLNHNNTSTYETKLLTFISDCLLHNDKVNKIRELTPTDLLIHILEEQIPISLVLVSKNMKHKLKQCSDDQLKLFDEFCWKCNVNKLMSIKNIVSISNNSTAELFI